MGKEGAEKRVREIVKVGELGSALDRGQRKDEYTPTRAAPLETSAACGEDNEYFYLTNMGFKVRKVPILTRKRQIDALLRPALRS